MNISGALGAEIKSTCNRDEIARSVGDMVHVNDDATSQITTLMIRVITEKNKMSVAYR